ncbi:MAG: class I SAM-dependent methyltransferase [Pirellulales bacterium]
MEPLNRDALIRSSWEANAAAWAQVVREGSIPSRRAGTDAAILSACVQLRPRRVLDLGCGEGWLARALSADGIEVVGVDCSAALIEAARIAGGANYIVTEYDSLIHDPGTVPGPFDTIVCNYSLFADPLAPLLKSLANRLAANGRLLAQTVHPWIAAGDGPYECGWREETFADFAADFPAAMPWYFRTLESWCEELRQSGLFVERVDEPRDSSQGRPLSIVFCCAPSPPASGPKRA